MSKIQLLLIFILQISVTHLYALTFSANSENKDNVTSLNSLNTINLVDIDILEVKSKNVDFMFDFFCSKQDFPANSAGFQVLK